jgi:hypothetical protein
MGWSLINMLGLSSSVRIAHTACYCKFFLLPVSTGFAEQIMPILRILCYNGSLVTWTIVSLTTRYGIHAMDSTNHLRELRQDIKILKISTRMRSSNRELSRQKSSLDRQIIIVQIRVNLFLHVPSLGTRLKRHFKALQTASSKLSGLYVCSRRLTDISISGYG